VAGATAAPETLALLERAERALGRAGATLTSRPLPAAFDSLVSVQPLVMNAESHASMGWELRTHPKRISEGLRERLAWGGAHSGADLDTARATMRALQAQFAAVMDGVDILITPAAPGEAPAGLDWTGDPAFNAPWTALHVPCVTVPAGTGPTGLPLGLQIVGRQGCDRDVLAASQWVAAVMAG
jgi:Asp-tRNA(Asn)/Glu-tRNA(Gln) amidotransferase A subunit family amidase